MRFANPEALASWPPPNLVDPVLRGPELYIVNSIFVFAASAAVLLRLYLRIFVRKWVGLDDYLLLFAWICGLGDAGAVYWGMSHVKPEIIPLPIEDRHACQSHAFRLLRYQWDRHFWDALHPEYLVPGAKTVFTVKLFWSLSSSFVQFSLLALYYRLIEHVDVLDRKTYKWVLHAATFFNGSILLSYLGTIIFDCANPDQYFQWPGTGYCINEAYANVILSSLNTFSEALVATLPIPVVISLHMDKNQRITVLGLLCLGFFVCVVGTVRTYFVWQLFESDDLTWYASPYWICSEVEICTAMICASVPALRSLVGRIWWGEQGGAVERRPSRRRKDRSSAGSNESSRHISTMEEGWIPPTQTQFDLEGIGLDGFGYTVTITGGRQRRQKRLANCFQGSPTSSNERLEMPSRWQFRKFGRVARRSLDSPREGEAVELRDKDALKNVVTHESTRETA